MNWVQLNQLPVVQHIITNAEKKIYAATGQKVTIEIGHSANADINEKERMKLLLKELVSIHFYVEWTDIESNSRLEKFCIARHAYIYLACKVFKQTHDETAKDVRRERSTITHSINLIEGYYDIKAPVINTIEKIKQKLIRL